MSKDVWPWTCACTFSQMFEECDIVTMVSYCYSTSKLYSICIALFCTIQFRCFKKINLLLGTFARNKTEQRHSGSCSLCLLVWIFGCVFSICIFCGERNESFTEEGLDLHYWKHCPMLKRCTNCKQVSQYLYTCI